MTDSMGRYHGSHAQGAPARSGLSPRGWVLLAFFGALAIYASTAAPSVLDHDSAELQAVAYTGGVAHTTGYPIYSMVGWLLTHLLPFGEPAFRVTLMSSLFGAASVAQVVVIGLEIGLAPAVAFAAAILYGAGFTFWAAAVRAEVYTLSTFVFLIAWQRSIIALRTGRTADRAWAALWLGLSLAGQLSCAPAVAVIGLAMAFDCLRRGLRLADVAALLFPLLLGLTPYFYTAWADVHAIGIDYLRNVDHVFFPATGVPDARFDTWPKRLAWLLSGLNMMPGANDRLTLSKFAHQAFKGGGLVVLFDLGPVATLLLIPGLRRLWQLDRGEFWRSGLFMVTSFVFASCVVMGPLFGIFMLYALVPLALVAAMGLDAVTQGFARTRRAVLLPALAVLVMVPPHALRVRAYERPIRPGNFQELDEDGSRPLYAVRRLHDPYQYRDFGRAALKVIPDSSLVVGLWRDMPILYYFRYVEKQRLDLALQQYSYPQHLYRLRVWQEQHDLARYPIVFLNLPGAMRPHVVAVESLDASRGHRLYVFRTPLKALPSGDGAMVLH